MQENENVYVARQVILDTEQNIFGYELLFRDTEQQSISIENDLLATTQVLLNTMNSIGVQKMIGDKWAFVNVNEKVLQQRVYETLDRDRFVLEILENTVVSSELIQQIKALREQGYTFALDDFIFNEEMLERFQPLFPFISVLKIDLTGNSLMTLKGHLEDLKNYDMKFLAEKVETREDFVACKEIGFDYFQGYFFSKPEVMKGERIQNDYLSLLKLIHSVRSKVENDEVESIFNRYPDVSLNLLRFMNSSEYGWRTKINSVRHAIDKIGRKKLTRWLMMMFYTNPNATDRMFTPLLELALQRARLMENVSKLHLSQDEEQADKAFYTGILSLVDVIFQVAMPKVLEELSVDSDIVKAIQHRAGVLGKMLALVQAIEVNNLNNLTHTMNELNLTAKAVNKCVEASYDNSFLFG